MVPTVVLPGGVTLFTFPILIGLGAALFCWYILAAADGKHPVSRTAGFLAATLAAGACGARVCYFLFYDLDSLLAHPLVILGDEGGLCFFGSLVAMLATGLAYLKLAGLPAIEFLALAAPAAAFAHGIGRIGCLLGGCCYGTVTRAPWAFAQPELSGDHLARHPTQVYEMAILFALGWALDRSARRGVSASVICRLYLGVLALERFSMEFLRGDTQGESVFSGLTFAQTICAVLAAFNLGWLAFDAMRRGRPEGILPEAAGTLRAGRPRRSVRCVKIRANA